MANKTIKLGPNDIRCGNLIYHDEPQFIKLVDVAGYFSYRISKFIPRGQILMIAMQQAEKDPSQMRYLENHAVVTFNAMTCVPDQQFFLEQNASAVNCINRHKDIYGVKEEILEKEDAQILQEERELAEAMEEAKKEEENEAPKSED